MPGLLCSWYGCCFRLNSARVLRRFRQLPLTMSRSQRLDPITKCCARRGFGSGRDFRKMVQGRFGFHWPGMPRLLLLEIYPFKLRTIKFFSMHWLTSSRFQFLGRQQAGRSNVFHFSSQTRFCSRCALVPHQLKPSKVCQSHPHVKLWWSLLVPA